jgi:hypothetical protein
LEVATPMPVGTEVVITTDEQVRFTASVSEIHEQIAGANHAPGMRVAPALVDASAQSWWAARTSITNGSADVKAAVTADPATASTADAARVAAATADAATAAAATAATAAAATAAAATAAAATVAAAPAHETTRPAPRRSAEILAQVEAESLTAAHEVVDDGRRTVAMDAVDPALIEQLLNGTPSAPNEGDPDPDSGPVSSTSSTAKKKSKRSKAR